MNIKTRELLIKTKRRLFGQNIGNNISAFRGNGIDFAELKEYSYGDDVRKINWKVTAREQKPYINVFNEERELNIVLAFVLSRSASSSPQRAKRAYTLRSSMLSRPMCWAEGPIWTHWPRIC